MLRALIRSRFGVAAFLPVIPLLFAACGDGEAAGGPVTAYEGAHVIVGDGTEPIQDAVLLVQDGSLLAVGPRAEIEVPGGAARVDLTGRTVMPALVNAHIHAPGGEREALVSWLEHNAYWGVGVVTSMGTDSSTASFELRQEAPPNLPRLLTAGRGITSPEPGRGEVPYWVTTPEEGSAAVQELAAKPVDIVKIWVDDRNGQYEKLPPSIYTVIIDEAHTHGLQVAAHIFALEDAKNLLRAGLDVFAHSVRDQDIDDEFVQLFLGKPMTVQVPNLPRRGVATDLSWLAATVPADRLAELQANTVDNPEQQDGFGIQARNLARLSEEGIRIAFGSDGGTPWQAHVELADMVAAGMSPADVIVAATRNSASLMGLTDTGTLEAGKTADFIVLEADPLQDITNTRRIVSFYLRGAEVDRAGIAARLNPPAVQ